MLTSDHAAMLARSGISPERAGARGYESITSKSRLAEVGITPAGRRVPGLLIPLRAIDGSVWGYQYRPDDPRTLATGQTIKYETPSGQRNGLDIPPGVGPQLADPSIPLWVTEGTKKADCAAAQGLCCVALLGVWGWRGTNNAGGKTALADWQDLALNGRRVILAYDSDVQRKQSVRGAMDALTNYLAMKGARVEFLALPDDGDKTGLDDYLVNYSVDQLWILVSPLTPSPIRRGEVIPPASPRAPSQPVPPLALSDAHTTFRRWFGDDYDTDALDIMLATVAVERFDDGSDPVWLLIISGPGAAKTETVLALDGIGATVTSAIASEAALLSATPRRERAKTATGGLLRKLGDRGLLVIKDVTSILSMNRDLRAKVLAALREVYDGRWYREVGTDGGHTIEWRGRIAVVGAVTTAWDTAHSVIASMGDRFVLVRINSAGPGRPAAGRRAISNTGEEQTMRAELAAAVAGVVAGMDTAPTAITDDEIDVLVAAADLVTRTRTACEFDFRGDVSDAHAPEMPTRFAKQLAQIVRGAVALGVDRGEALRLALRCARDSVPPLRLAIIEDLTEHPGTSTQAVRKRLDKPRATTDRQLQALHMLGIATVEEQEYTANGRTRWFYALAEGVDVDVLKLKVVPDLSVYG
jgi:hypothetical protein